MDDDILSKISEQMRPLVRRRAKWLLEEARQVDARKDEAIDHLMRVLSSYVTLGRDYKSFGVKTVNRRVSEGAKKLLCQVSFGEWHKATTNDHRKRIEEMWSDLRKFNESWTTMDVLKQFYDWPMTTILKDTENKRLAEFKTAAAIDRYSLADINVEILDCDPKSFKDR